jgi:hypothetical protein
MPESTVPKTRRPRIPSLKITMSNSVAADAARKLEPIRFGATDNYKDDRETIQEPLDQLEKQIPAADRRSTQPPQRPTPATPANRPAWVARFLTESIRDVKWKTRNYFRNRSTLSAHSKFTCAAARQPVFSPPPKLRIATQSNPSDFNSAIISLGRSASAFAARKAAR